MTDFLFTVIDTTFNLVKYHLILPCYFNQSGFVSKRLLLNNIYDRMTPEEQQSYLKPWPMYINVTEYTDEELYAEIIRNSNQECKLDSLKAAYIALSSFLFIYQGGMATTFVVDNKPEFTWLDNAGRYFGSAPKTKFSWFDFGNFFLSTCNILYISSYIGDEYLLPVKFFCGWSSSYIFIAKASNLLTYINDDETSLSYLVYGPQKFTQADTSALILSGLGIAAVLYLIFR